MKFTCVKAFFFIKLNRCFNLKKKILRDYNLLQARLP